MEKLDRDWDAAYLRLEDYLRAHGVEPRERLLELVLDIAGRAKILHARHSGKSPTEVTMELAIGKTDAWFSVLAGEPDKVARARVAFFSAPFQQKWAPVFLNPVLPDGLLAEVRSACIDAGPALDFQSLVRKEMDYGAMEDLARETWDQFSWSHVLRAFVLWVAVFFIAYGIYLKFFA